MFVFYHIAVTGGNKMKVLILTAKFGMGHISAAKAVSEEIKKNNKDADTVTVDLMEHIYPGINKIIYKTFNLLVHKMPKLYDALLYMDAYLSKFPLRGKFANAEIIQALVNEYKPDMIVSTWLISSKYIEAYKKKTGDAVPFITCITDIIAYNEWITGSTDAYMVGDEATKQSLISRGVDPDIIYVGGIPVRPVFGKRKSSRKDADSVREVLVMGGGLGLIPKADEILTGLNDMKNTHVTVITGGNQKLYKYLKKKHGTIEAVGYTDNVAYYMDRADVIVTKAGGSTLFESIRSEVPMFVIEPFLMQEKANAKYIEDKQIGKVIWRSRSGGRDGLRDLICDDLMRTEMKKNMRNINKNIEENNINNIIHSVSMCA